jgi:CubicO group peptidase (beta-lactamase class C family)
MLNVHRLEQRIADEMEAAGVPGLALALVHRQEVVYAGGAGVTSVENGGAPVTPQTLFRIASTTKPLVGTAIMRLVEAGTLDLERPLSAYVPWLQFSQPGIEDHLTLRHLLSHTSGLPQLRGDLDTRDPGALATFVREKLSSYPLLVPPGRLWLYSGAGIALAAFVAEVASGMAFPDLMRRLVFDPLDMQRTTFDPLVAMTYPLAQAHTAGEEGTLHVEHRFIANAVFDPAGGAMSTALDLANFAILHLNQGRFRDRQLLSPESVRTMQTPVVSLWTFAEEGYGLAFATERYKGVRLVRHNGGGLASYASCFYLAPDEEMAVVLLANGGRPMPILRHLLDQLFELPEQPETPEAIVPDRAAWPRYVGTYLGIYTGLAAIQIGGDQLILELNGEQFPLSMREPDLYFGQRSGGGPLISVGFLPEGEGPTRFIVLNNSPCERVDPPGAIVPDPEAWAAYSGTYVVPEAAMLREDTYVVRVEGDRLVFQPRHGEAFPCIALDDARFACGAGLLEFHVTDAGPMLEYMKTFALTRVFG